MSSGIIVIYLDTLFRIMRPERPGTWFNQDIRKRSFVTKLLLDKKSLVISWKHSDWLVFASDRIDCLIWRSVALRCKQASELCCGLTNSFHDAQRATAWPWLEELALVPVNCLLNSHAVLKKHPQDHYKNDCCLFKWSTTLVFSFSDQLLSSLLLISITIVCFSILNDRRSLRFKYEKSWKTTTLRSFISLFATFR